MPECSGNVRIVCGLSAAAAIIVACPARAEDAYCYNTPDLSKNPALELGHVASAANRVHFFKGSNHDGCASRASDCAMSNSLVPGDHVIISARHDAFICTTSIDAKGSDRPFDGEQELSFTCAKQTLFKV